MKRTRLLSFAVLAYLWFLLDIVWAVAFLADVGPLAGVDEGPEAAIPWAIGIDLVALGAFSVHHSVMARDGAKRLITRIVPAAAERSTYVLGADVLLALVLWQWRPVGATVWDVRGEPWAWALWAGYGSGWVIAVASTFMVNHADLVGLRQAATPAGRYRPPTFRERWFYTWVRHPLMLGLLIAFWATPRMSLGHLLFAAALTAYILVGIRLEERSLRASHGAEYGPYAARVPALVPRPLSRRGPTTGRLNVHDAS